MRKLGRMQCSFSGLWMTTHAITPSLSLSTGKTCFLSLNLFGKHFYEKHCFSVRRTLFFKMTSHVCASEFWSGKAKSGSCFLLSLSCWEKAEKMAMKDRRRSKREKERLPAQAVGNLILFFTVHLNSLFLFASILR